MRTEFPHNFALADYLFYILFYVLGWSQDENKL